MWKLKSILGVICRSPHGERGLKLSHLLESICLTSSRSPHGERGLKSFVKFTELGNISRSPHGERGLKYVQDDEGSIAIASLSSRRAWIEITYVVSPSNNSLRSLSSRRAWIEICWILEHLYYSIVALLTESVDWNLCLLYAEGLPFCRSPHGERGLKYQQWQVFAVLFLSLSSRRAWIEIIEIVQFELFLKSLSSRRAWIEILLILKGG